MAAAGLLIDGYNLLHAAGLARNHFGPGDLQRARQQLLRFLARHLSKAELSATTLVFDARDPPAELPQRWVIHGVRVFFAPPEDDGDADAFIEALLERHPQPRQLTLVSSDHRLQQAARRRGASWADSEEFVERLTSRKSAAAVPHRKRAVAEPRRDAPLTAGEVAEWLAVFGDVQPLEPPSRRSHRLSPGNEAPPATARPSRRSPPATSVPQTPAPASSTPSASAPPASAPSTFAQTASAPNGAKTNGANTGVPAPQRNARKRRGKPPAPHVKSPVEEVAPRASPAGAPLFSADWLQALQEWVDEQQFR